MRDENSKVTTGFVAFFSYLFFTFDFHCPFLEKKHANVGDGDSHSRGLEFSTPVAWNLAVGNFMVLMCWCGGKPSSSYQQQKAAGLSEQVFLALLEVSTNVMQEVVDGCCEKCFLWSKLRFFVNSNMFSLCLTQWIRRLSKRLAILVLYHR